LKTNWVKSYLGDEYYQSVLIWSIPKSPVSKGPRQSIYVVESLFTNSSIHWTNKCKQNDLQLNSLRPVWAWNDLESYSSVLPLCSHSLHSCKCKKHVLCWRKIWNARTSKNYYFIGNTKVFTV